MLTLVMSLFCIVTGPLWLAIGLMLLGIGVMTDRPDLQELKTSIDSFFDSGPIAALTLIATGGVLLGFGKMPYGYYLLLRLLLCGASLFVLFGAKLILPTWQQWALVGFAFLYNPVVPIRLGDKGAWLALNVATAGLFWVISLQRRPESQRNG